MRLYFGGNAGIQFLPQRPIFMTPEVRWGAYWYAIDRSDLNPTIYELEVTVTKTAKEADVVAAAKEVRATKNDVAKACSYEGENPFDFSYLTVVQNELCRKGFDAIEGHDVLSNSTIQIFIVWNPKQVQILRQHPVTLATRKFDFLSDVVQSFCESENRKNETDVDSH